MKNIHILESMSGYIARLHYKLKQLHSRNRIGSFWFFNGTLYYKLDDKEDSKKIPVYHLQDLQDTFTEDEDILQDEV